MEIEIGGIHAGNARLYTKKLETTGSGVIMILFYFK